MIRSAIYLGAVGGSHVAQRAMLTHRDRWLSNLIVLDFASMMAIVSEQCNLASNSVRPGIVYVLGSAARPYLSQHSVQPGAFKSGATLAA